MYQKIFKRGYLLIWDFAKKKEEELYIYPAITIKKEMEESNYCICIQETKFGTMGF